MGGGKVT
ncbi:unnamed protein product, partial [Didymodactylos carnosus]